MSNLIELKKRIASISSTTKVTKVMYMISTSKMNKLREQYKLSKYIFENINNTMFNIVLNNKYDEKISKLFTKNEKNKTLLIVFSSDKGLCGSINTSVLKEMKHTIKELQDDDNKEIEILPIGKKISSFLEKNEKKLDIKLMQTLQIKSENLNEIPYQDIINQKNIYQFDQIICIYNTFKNIITTQIKKETIFPLNIDEYNQKDHNLINIQQSEDINVLIDNYFKYKLLQICTENALSIASSRMNAMDNATKNGIEIRDNLKLKFNKIRQGIITSELIDIVSGCESISN